MRGFLCTCNAKERDCVREAYNILGRHGDKLCGEEEIVSKFSSPNDEEGCNKEEKEIEDELKTEVESLKTNEKSFEERRFQVVDTGANNCVFIKTTVPDPVELVNDIMNDIEMTRQRRSRYLMRMMPIEVTCKAYLDDIKKECEKLFEKHFKCDPTTYAIVYNKRYNNNVLRGEIIESLARLIQDRNILHKADLKQAKKTVIVEVIKNICCISVVPDYFRFRKYNLLELYKKVTDNDGDNEEPTGNEENENKNDVNEDLEKSEKKDVNDEVNSELKSVNSAKESDVKELKSDGPI